MDRMEAASLNSFTDDFDKNPLSSFAVELAVKNLLPWTKIESPLCDRHYNFSSHHLPFRWASALSSPTL